MAHTKGELIIKPIRNIDFELFDKKGRLLARCWREDVMSEIIYCVNSHDALLEACKEANNLIEIARQYFPISIKNSDKFKLENVCATLSTAIALTNKP